MLICFGSSWPLAVAKTSRTKVVLGKSPVFLILIFIGYLSGIFYKLTMKFDHVIWLYALLGPDPVRVGHVTIISDEAAEIQFYETNGKAAIKFSEFVVAIPEYNSAFLSGKPNVETVSCCAARINGSRLQSRMRKCVISLSNLNSIKRGQLKNACL